MDATREALEAEMDRQETSTPEPVRESAKVETPTTVGPVSEPAVIAETAETKAARARDEEGKFTKAPKDSGAAQKGAEKAGKPVAAASDAKAGGTVPPATPPGASAAPPAEAVTPAKIPASFRPAARELAQKLPAEFHPLLEESIRIDNEAKRALNDSAQARKMAETVSRTLAPYETIARANGMDAMAYAGSVLQAAAGLQMGTQAQKDQLLAQLITTYGGNVDGINAHLSGQAAPATAQQQPINVEAAFNKMWEDRLGQVQESAAQRKATEFIDSAPEFLNDVWPDMVEILRVAEARKQPMEYADAYKRACRLNEEVSKIETQRAAAKAATATNAATQRSVEAASGVKTNPTSAGNARPRDIRSALEEEADRQGMR